MQSLVPFAHECHSNIHHHHVAASVQACLLRETSDKMTSKEEDYTSDLSKLPKLKGSENYREWSFKVK